MTAFLLRRLLSARSTTACDRFDEVQIVAVLIQISRFFVSDSGFAAWSKLLIDNRIMDSEAPGPLRSFWKQKVDSTRRAEA